MMAEFIEKQQEHSSDRAQAFSALHQPRNRTKALVIKGVRNGREVAIKDYSRCRALIRAAYGRPTLRREARAYALLRGIAGIPECLGFEGRDALVIEYIDGRTLKSFKRGEVDAAVFDKLNAVMKCAHERGVAFGDLHASNVIITENGGVFLIDFALAVFIRDSRRPGLFARLVMELDRHSARRMRARYLRLPAPVPRGLFGVLYRFGRGLKSARQRIKKIMKAGV
jgi:RIO-like serine/threonine protein kinase